jgi:hypothetical protein
VEERIQWTIRSGLRPEIRAPTQDPFPVPMHPLGPPLLWIGRPFGHYGVLAVTAVATTGVVVGLLLWRSAAAGALRPGASRSEGSPAADRTAATTTTNKQPAKAGHLEVLR